MLKRKVTTRYDHFGIYFWIEQEYFEVPLLISPVIVWTSKLSRGINRLLPVGHRYRGDVGSYA
ncbi:hypothetical protein [Sporosarcina highlanderae]|uniref:Uncharacterized protein n=1 Tax=Sporosarcina highlanderae TaxID=3035916 RepID=A0ABT8JVF5_9BACL|nr:hypothetical protein [Sporosarcina highlanderae]MDN4609160.1 hypothetical protein [Sporosarcina highlanderae]